MARPPVATLHALRPFVIITALGCVTLGSVAADDMRIAATVIAPAASAAVGVDRPPGATPPGAPLAPVPSNPANLPPAAASAPREGRTPPAKPGPRPARPAPAASALSSATPG